MIKITPKSTSKAKPSTRFWDLEDSTFSVGTVNIYDSKTKEHQHVDNFSFDAASSPLETVYNVLEALSMSKDSAKIELSDTIPGLYHVSNCRKLNSNSRTIYDVEMRLRAQPSLGLKYNYTYWKYYNAKQQH